MNICVVGGAGYVGLITGAGLADIGHSVANVDLDSERVAMLQAGVSPIYESGIEPVLRRNLDAGRLRFSCDLKAAAGSSDIIFIAVGTPSRDDGQVDLSYVIQVAEDLVRYLDSYAVVVIKSTVPVGTVELVRSILGREKEEGTDFDVVANPEFLREGKGLFDFFCPDRIVIGSHSERATGIMRELYGPIIRGEASWLAEAPDARATRPAVVETDLSSAQMIKYASNTFLATRISFINEIAGLCERVGADITEVARGMGHDPRIGHAYLEPGLGFGGPCLEKDLRALIKVAEGTGYEPQLLRSVLERNARQVEDVVAKLKRLTGYLLYRKIVAVYGLAFKAGTNDLRNSLALKVIDRLEKEGAIVRAHDPLAIPEARALNPNIVYCEDPYDCVCQAEALLVLTEWPCFRDLDYREVRDRMAFPRIVDSRNLLDAGALRAMGLTYVGMGIP